MKGKLLLATGALLAGSAVTAQDKLDFGFYGILKSSVINASQSVSSYGLGESHAAITQANRADTASAKSRRMTLQTQQSRFGFTLAKGERVSGKIEFDFIDYGESTHGVGEHVRLRLAQVNYKLSDNAMISAGQKWLTFNGVNPYMNNLVQANFYSGNSGFIGQEAVYKYSTNGLDLYGGILAKGKNSASNTQNESEYGSTPALTARADFKFSNGLIGVAGLWGKLEAKNLSDATSETENGNAFAYKIFTKMGFGGLDIRAEAFAGQNTEDFALLALNGSSYTYKNGTNEKKNVKTYGGFISTAYKFNKTHTVYGGAGMAANRNAQALGLTLQSNKMARLGYEYHAGDGLKFFIVDSQYQTTYAADHKSFDANVVEGGIMWAFK